MAPKVYTKRTVKTRAQRDAESAALQRKAIERQQQPEQDITAPIQTQPEPAASTPSVGYTSARPSPEAAPAEGLRGTRLQIELPVPATSVAGSNVASSDPPYAARSIRCKKSKAVQVDASGQPPKKKRGVVVGAKTKEMARNEPGGKIEVEWDDELNQPAKKSIGGQMARDIGSKVKDEVPMKTAVYGDLDPDDKGIVYDYISTYYRIIPHHDGQWNYIQNVAADRYKDWKHDCKQHWVEYGDEVPLEFLHRPDQWEFLCKEFKKPENKELGERMQKIRTAEKRMNHHSGTTSFGYRTRQHEKDGHAAPWVATFVDVYAKDKVGGPHAEAIERDIQEKIKKRTEDQPDVPPNEPLPVESQLSAITSQVGETNGTRITGVGRCLKRQPKKRGGCSRADIDALVEERLSQVTDKIKRDMEIQMAASIDEKVQSQVAAFMKEWMEKQSQTGKGTPDNDSTSHSDPSPQS